MAGVWRLRKANISAGKAVTRIHRSSLSPKDMDKMLQSPKGQVIISELSLSCFLLIDSATKVSIDFGAGDEFIKCCEPCGAGGGNHRQAGKKAAPLEMLLTCSLEELYKGSKRKMMISKIVSDDFGLQQSALDNTGKLFDSTQQSKLKKMSNGMPTSETSEQEPEKMKQVVPTNDDDDDATEEQGKAKSKGEEGGKASKTILNGAVENGRGKSNDTSTNKKRMKELTGKDESDDASITTKRMKGREEKRRKPLIRRQIKVQKMPLQSSSSILEYLMEMLPGWQVQDLLDSSSDPVRFYKDSDDNGLLFFNGDVESKISSYENNGIWVSQAPNVPQIDK
ncbi:hypothetical protein V2J09_001825 [Rumex salicifolius]